VFRAENNYIIVELDEEVEMVRPSGLLLPGLQDNLPAQGVVVSAGPGEYDSRGRFVPLDWIKVGDRVVFEKRKETGVNRPRGIELDGKPLVYLDAHGVLAILED
jgi:co-chaperonin GroES (HSP10)